MSINWEAIAAGGTVASVLAAIGALFYQILSLKRSIQSSTYQDIVQIFNEFSRLMIDHPELERMIFSKEAGLEIANEYQSRVDWAIALRFDWFESIVIQKKKYKAVPEDIYRHWLGVLKEELTRPTIHRHWNDNGRFYHPHLQREVAKILKPLSPPLCADLDGGEKPSPKNAQL